MEALKFETSADLDEALAYDERLELINGVIIKRPLPRSRHGKAQGEVFGELRPYNRKKSSDHDEGWFFFTEIDVQYNEFQRPTHDVAGWKKSRLPILPDKTIMTPPDWVCEIVSKGHEDKDTVDNFITLQKYQVPFYWVIWPEKQVLIAYELIKNKYSAIETIQGGGKYKIRPFDEIEFDLDYVFGNK